MGRRGLLCTTSSPSPRECHTQLLALVIHWVATLVSVRTLWKSPFQKWVLRGQVELPPRGPGRRGPLPSPGSCLQAASACRVVRSGKPADATPGADTEGTGFDGDSQRELDGAATQTGRVCPGRPCPDPPAGRPLLPRVWRCDLKGCERHGAGTLTSHTPSTPGHEQRTGLLHSFTRSLVRSVWAEGVQRCAPSDPSSEPAGGWLEANPTTGRGRPGAGRNHGAGPRGPVPPARTHASCLGPSEASRPFCPHQSQLVGLTTHSPASGPPSLGTPEGGGPSLRLHHADEHVEGDATSVAVATELGLEPV